MMYHGSDMLEEPVVGAISQKHDVFIFVIAVTAGCVVVSSEEIFEMSFLAQILVAQ